MKLLIFTTLIAACAAASFNPFAAQAQAQYRSPQYNQEYQVRPRAGLERSAKILRSDAEVNERGYQFAFETENGIQAQETGVEADGIQAQGQYSYTGDDGQVYSVRYTADGNGGFQAQGAHIPTAPPVPEEIAQALLRNAQDEANGIFDDGSYHEGKYGSSDTGSGVVIARNYQPAFRQPAFRAPTQYNY